MVFLYPAVYVAILVLVVLPTVYITMRHSLETTYTRTRPTVSSGSGAQDYIQTLDRIIYDGSVHHANNTHTSPFLEKRCHGGHGMLK